MTFILKLQILIRPVSITTGTVDMPYPHKPEVAEKCQFVPRQDRYNRNV